MYSSTGIKPTHLRKEYITLLRKEIECLGSIVIFYECILHPKNFEIPSVISTITICVYIEAMKNQFNVIFGSIYVCWEIF